MFASAANTSVEKDKSKFSVSNSVSALAKPLSIETLLSDLLLFNCNKLTLDFKTESLEAFTFELS